MAQSLRVARLNLYRPIPSDPSDWFDAEEIAQSRAYNRPLQRFSFLYGGVSFALLALLTLLHAAPRAIEATGARVWPLQLLVALAVVLVPLEAVTVPMDAWKARYLRRWEMATQISLARHLAGELGGFLAGIVVAAVLAFPLWALIRLTSLWWALMALVLLAVGVVFTILMPLFGHATPIDDDDLRRRVRKVSREAGVDVIDVFRSDESRRTPLQQGYIGGIGRARRLILSDNLLTRPPAEIDVFLARKISHIRRHHNVLRVVFLFALISVQFALVRLALGWTPLLQIAGVRSVRDPGALPLAALVFAATFIVVELGAAWVQRAQARMANVDSLEFTRDADAYTALIRGLHTHNREELAPSWWRRLKADQPTAAELLALGVWWRARRRVTVLFYGHRRLHSHARASRR